MADSLIALTIFLAIYALIVLNLVDRTVAVIFGALTMVGLGILSEEEAIGSIHWDVHSSRGAE